MVLGETLGFFHGGFANHKRQSWMGALAAFTLESRRSNGLKVILLYNPSR